MEHMPICYSTIKEVPMVMLDNSHALKNHNQTLKRLKERKGISAWEAVAIIDGLPLFPIPKEDQDPILLARINLANRIFDAERGDHENQTHP